MLDRGDLLDVSAKFATLFLQLCLVLKAATLGLHFPLGYRCIHTLLPICLPSFFSSTWRDCSAILLSLTVTSAVS